LRSRSWAWPMLSYHTAAVRALCSTCATWLVIRRDSVEPPDIFGMAKVFYAIVDTTRDISNEIVNASVKDGVVVVVIACYHLY